MYNVERRTVLSNIKIIDRRFLDLTENILLKTVLFGNSCNH